MNALRAPKSIARILRNGRTCGAGFLCGNNTLMTCAHVVNLALGLQKNNAEHPGPVRVELAFPFHQGATIVATLGLWLPLTAQATGDIAVLALAGVEPDMEPLNAGVDYPQLGERLNTYGFPDLLQAIPDPGMHTYPVFDGIVTSEWCQLFVPERSPIVSGFSGAPAWNIPTGTVMGMITAYLGGDLRIGYMVSATAIRAALARC